MAGREKPWVVDDEVGGGGVVVLLEHRLVEESQVFLQAMAGEQVPAAVAIVVGFLGIFAAILSGLALRGANA